jgi:hypothetical protein
MESNQEPSAATTTITTSFCVECRDQEVIKKSETFVISMTLDEGGGYLFGEKNYGLMNKHF